MQEAEANSTALANAQEELRQQAADMADQLAAVRSHPPLCAGLMRALMPALSSCAAFGL